MLKFSGSSRLLALSWEFLSRPLKPAALACGGDGQVEDALAESQVTADPFIDFCVVAAYLFLLHTGPRISPIGAGLACLFFLSFFGRIFSSLFCTSPRICDVFPSYTSLRIEEDEAELHSR